MCPLSERRQKTYHKENYMSTTGTHTDLPVRLQKEVYIQWDCRGYTRSMCHIINMVFEGTESLYCRE